MGVAQRDRQRHSPGVFRTDLNSALLDSPRGQEFLVRTPMHRFGTVEELVGAAVFLASDAADVRHRPCAGRRWWLPGERGQSVKSVLSSSASATTSRRRSKPLEPGRASTVRTGTVIVARRDSARAQGGARRAISTGEAVIKYGSPIGTASADIEAGRTCTRTTLRAAADAATSTLHQQRASRVWPNQPTNVRTIGHRAEHVWHT